MTENELIEWMGSLGFKGEQLEKDLKESTGLNLPVFSINHRMKFGKEDMFFEIGFIKDGESYKPEKVKATHRAEPKIDHQIINGIDTFELEQRLGQINWEGYFSKKGQASDPDAIPEFLLH